MQNMAKVSTVTAGSVALGVAVGPRQKIADQILGKADVIRAVHESVELCQDPQTALSRPRNPTGTAADVFDEVGQRSLERLFPGLREDSTTHATLSAGQSRIGFERARDIAAPAHLGSHRSQAAYPSNDPRRSVGRPSPRADPGGAARLTAVIEAATSTYLSALDDDVNSLGTAGIACQKPDHCIPGTSQLRLPRGRQRRHGLLSAFRSHFGSSHVLLERAYDFLCHELFWFCLVQVSTTQFCSFPSFLMARASDGTDVPVSPFPASSSNIGSLSGSLPDFEGTGIRPSAMEWKIKGMFVQVAKLPLRTQSVSRFEICVQTLAQTVASYDAKITNMERIVSSLAARVSTL